MVSAMSSEEDLENTSQNKRSYLIMKADSKNALKLAEEWWSDKETPSYVKIQPLDMIEIASFVELYNRCFLASPDPFCPLTIDEARKLDPEGIFVARLAGRPVGFIACFLEKKADSIYGEITGIGVLPNRRRNGIATALIKRATNYFLDAGADEVYCEVYEDNLPSQMLIKTYGFEEVGRRDIPIGPTPSGDGSSELPGGKIMRRLGLRPRAGCESCRDI